MHSKQEITLLNSIGLPLLIVFLMWFVFFMEWMLNTRFYELGIFPKSIDGLKGIVFSAFLHGDYKHIINNTLPAFILTWTLSYFYRSLTYKVFLISWLIGGFFVWIAARASFHIGMSGIIYSLAFFIFFSGVFRKEPRVMSISLFVLFLYGSMVWGIFPVDTSISFESHLIGAILGTGMAYFFKNEGATFVKKKYNFELEEEQDRLMQKKGYKRVEDENGFLLHYELENKSDDWLE
jgi:membrane associated rhomboid family serine protease